MEIRVFVVLLIFMFLFIGGGILTLMGYFTGNKRKKVWGFVLLGLCLIFMVAMKYVKGLY